MYVLPWLVVHVSHLQSRVKQASTAGVDRMQKWGNISPVLDIDAGNRISHIRNPPTFSPRSFGPSLCRSLTSASAEAISLCRGHSGAVNWRNNNCGQFALASCVQPLVKDEVRYWLSPKLRISLAAETSRWRCFSSRLPYNWLRRFSFPQPDMTWLTSPWNESPKKIQARSPACMVSCFVVKATTSFIHVIVPEITAQHAQRRRIRLQRT